ncbi:hypothetical protein BJX68DRAFT_71903 [Aspergillus pseudodeflectus]|uniref:Uncharacterized protein n=1 Tax=Aspergillus pseudodeflectus TaxID=176178 RepID=A0ABR4KGE0_9EURO
MPSTSATLLHPLASTTIPTATSLTAKQILASTTGAYRWAPSTHITCLSSSCVKDTKWDRAFWGISWTEGSSGLACHAGKGEDKKQIKIPRPREGIMTEDRFREMEEARVEAVRTVKGE